MTNYATYAEIVIWMPENSFNATSSDETYGDIIESALTRSSRLIDMFTHRESSAYAVAAETTRYFDGNGKLEQFFDEMATAPSLVAMAEGGDVADAAGAGGNYTTYVTSDYLLWPYNAQVKSPKMPFTKIVIDLLNGTRAGIPKYKKAVKITTKFGYSDTDNLPEEIIQATIIQSTRLIKRAQQAWQDAGAIEALQQIVYVKELDPDVKNIVKSFRRGRTML